jgi:hypothetical protein
MSIIDTLKLAGVRNLREYGYPGATAENITKDHIYAAFFLTMLEDTRPKLVPEAQKDADVLIAECKAA